MLAQRPDKLDRPLTGFPKPLEKPFNDKQRAESHKGESTPLDPRPSSSHDDPSRTRESFPVPGHLQTLRDTLQRLYRLGKDSPQFHQNLSDFLRGNEYQKFLSSPQREVSSGLAEYLNGVGLIIILLHNMLTIGTGSYGNSRSPKPCFPGILVWT